jgi:GT2 family glycosyltransferase
LVVIVAFEAGVHLQRCLDALENQTYQGWRAIVWDNASSDEAAERLTVSWRVMSFRSLTNLGFAAANNGAAALLPSSFIVTLNPDAFPEPDWLERLVATAERWGAAAVGSLQLDDLDPSRLDGAGDCMSIAGIAWRGGYGHKREVAPTEICEIFAPCAAAALYRRDAFEAAGGFDERFFCYYEDVDLGFRIRLAGGTCLLDPGAVVRHVGSATTRQISGFAEYHGFRNRIWSFARNMPLTLLPIAVPAHLLVTLYILARSPNLLAVRLRALKDALAGLAHAVRLRDQQLVAPMSLVRAITWSPIDLSRRAIKARRLPPDEEAA